MLPRPVPVLSWLVVVLVTVLMAAPPASAHEVPPLEVTFPQDVSVTEFHNDWGSKRSGGRRHIGIDLMAPKMTEVYALADGVVLKVASSARAGRYVIIGHESGWETYYIHLNNDTPGTDDGEAGWALTVAPGVFVGSQVVGGQLIGWVGDSGNAEGSMSHTHFELHHDGRPINPYHMLVAAGESGRQGFSHWLLDAGGQAAYID